MLDVGAGCGVVGLLVAKDFPKISLYGVEKQPLLAKYARKNAQENGISYTLYEGEYQDLPETTRYDFIVSNPPFYHDGVQKSDNEMLFYARYNSNLPIEAFIKKTARLLRPHGHFVFCYDESQFGLLCAALERVKMRVVDVRFVHPKRNKKASLVMVHARNNSKSYMRVHPPLFTFEGERFSEEAQEIFKKAGTNSIKCKI